MNADLGGMLYGFLCGMSTIERLSADFFGMEEGFMTNFKHIAIRGFGLILTLVFIITTLVVLLLSNGTTTPCPNCTWLSCVPFPPWESDDTKWWYCDDCGRATADIVSAPTLHLELDCPNGSTVNVPLGSQEDYDRNSLQKSLPTYCREYCYETTEDNETPGYMDADLY
jgi:hypothetical protein